MNVADEYALDVIRHRYMCERNAYRELVGTLYPSICYEAMQRLKAQYIKAGGDPLNLPSAPPPRCDGSAPYFN